MEYYQILLITLVPLTLILILSRINFNCKKNEAKTNGILRIPRFYRIIPFLVFCFSFVATICILIFHLDDWPYILLWMGFLGMPSLILSVLWSLWRVEIKSEGFVFRNFLGKKKEYIYNELEYIEHPKGMKWYFYKDNRKILCMPYYIDGGDALIKAYKKSRYKE